MASDRYLIAYLISSKNISKFTILENFIYNISSIASKTNDYKMSQIRYQWHIDYLKVDNLQEGITYLNDLKQLIYCEKLCLEDFTNLISKKAQDLETFPFKTTYDLIKYALKTEYIIWKNYAKIIGANSKVNLKAIRYVSIAYCILGVIRNYLYFSQKDIYLLLSNEKEIANKSILDSKIKNLIGISQKCIVKSKKFKLDSIGKRFLLLNFITDGYITNIINNKFDVYKFSHLSVGKQSYVKILMNLLRIF